MQAASAVVNNSLIASCNAEGIVSKRPGHTLAAAPATGSSSRILAELPGRPRERFTMFSTLENPARDIDCSGMSGGPIFWSTGEEYGILGIIYEGGPGQAHDSIYVFGEIATPDTIKSWIAQCPPLQRDNLLQPQPSAECR
jgi:hypothetical protein